MLEQPLLEISVIKLMREDGIGYCINQLSVIQFLYSKSGSNHMNDKLGRYKAVRPIQMQLGQYRNNSDDTTWLITMTSSASFPTHTNMADVFKWTVHK